MGDSLKEFHRRRQEILDVIKQEQPEEIKEENSAKHKPDEFQHVDGENADFHTQALGAADKDQVQSIDEDKAIDDEEENANHQEDIEIKEEDEIKMKMKMKMKKIWNRVKLKMKILMVILKVKPRVHLWEKEKSSII